MARWRWWFAALAAGLLIAGTLAGVYAEMPFAVSSLDAVVFVGLGVVIGIYVIQARAERDEVRSGREGRRPAGENPRSQMPETEPEPKDEG